MSYAFVGKCFFHIQGMLECAIGKIVGKHVLVMGMIGYALDSFDIYA